MRDAPLPRPLVVMVCLVACLSGLVAAPHAHAAPTTISRSDAALLTSLVATAAGQDARLDVLTRADIQQAMNLAADQQMMSCDAAAGACLAELAQAMNATSVLHGSVGTLGDDVALTLSLFDTTTARAVGRAVAQAHDIGGLGARIDATVAAVLKDLPAPPPGTRTRIVVLDLEIAGANASAGDASAAPPSSGALSAGTWTRIGAGAFLAAGAVFSGLALGREAAVAASERELDDVKTPASSLGAVLARRNAEANDGRMWWGLAAASAVVGTGVMFVPLAWGE